MKRLLGWAVVTMFGFSMLAQSQKVTVTVESESRPPEKEFTQDAAGSHTVVLVVQNHAPLGVTIPMMALSDALTAKLSDHGFQVINPYNSVGVNQNRNVLGEKTPEVSAMELARKLKADGAIMASVLEFRELLHGSSPAEYRQYSVRITLNLADAQTGAAVCGETIKCKSPKYTKSQVAKNKQEYLGDLMFSAAEECAERLKNNQSVKNWKPTPPPPPKPLPPPPDDPWLTLSDIDGVVQEHIDSNVLLFHMNTEKYTSSLTTVLM